MSTDSPTFASYPSPGPAVLRTAGMLLLLAVGEPMSWARARETTAGPSSRDDGVFLSPLRAAEGFPGLGPGDPGTSWRGLTLPGGRYQIIDRLAEDETGSVYLARDLRLGTEVAVRLPRTDAPRSLRANLLNLRAMRALARADHPHLVRVTDVGELSGIPFAVMGVPSGGNLKFRRRVGPDGRPAPADPSSLVGWLLPTAEALDYLHARGYVPTDLSPSHILFDAHGRAYLAAFGLARAADPSGRLPTEPGPPADEPSGDHLDGQRALARMVEQWLTGRDRQRGSGAPTVPPALVPVLSRGLATAPGRQFPDCASFARAVLAAVPRSGTSPTGGADHRSPPLLVIRAPSWAGLRAALPSRVGPATALGGAALLFASGLVALRRAAPGSHKDKGGDAPSSSESAPDRCLPLRVHVPDASPPELVRCDEAQVLSDAGEELEVTCQIVTVLRWRESVAARTQPPGHRAPVPVQRMAPRRRAWSLLPGPGKPRRLARARGT